MQALAALELQLAVGWCVEFWASWLKQLAFRATHPTYGSLSLEKMVFISGSVVRNSSQTPVFSFDFCCTRAIDRDSRRTGLKSCKRAGRSQEQLKATIARYSSHCTSQQRSLRTMLRWMKMKLLQHATGSRSYRRDITCAGYMRTRVLTQGKHLSN